MSRDSVFFFPFAFFVYRITNVLRKVSAIIFVYLDGYFGDELFHNKLVNVQL